MLDPKDPIRKLVILEDNNYSALTNLEAGFLHLDPEAPTVKLLISLWAYVKKLIGITGFLSSTPLWRNRQLKEIQKLKGFKSWEDAGIKYISQLYQDNTLKSFQQIQTEFGIPHNNFYKYLQLRHALQTQNRTVRIQPTEHPIIQDVFMDEVKKGMISRCYNTLIARIQDPSRLPCRQRWEEDIGAIDGDTWEICLMNAPLVSISTSQKLSHLYLLHRAYRTPLQLYKWGIRDSPLCPKCERDHGNLLHMIWKCPKLFRYWKEVLDTISEVYMIPLERTPVVCVLGGIDEELAPPPTCIALIRLLYIAKKLIAQWWITPRVPTRVQWIDSVNRLLIREKITYQRRKAPQKFLSIWQAWLDVPGLAPHQLIKDKLLLG